MSFPPGDKERGFFQDCCKRQAATPSASVLAQQLERMGPIIAQEAGNEPEHAERLDSAGGLGFAHVGRLPAELVEDAAHRLLCRVVVAADEHSRFALLEAWVDHERAADGIERLDEAG